MHKEPQSRERQQKRAAVRTALILGFVAVAIFSIFIDAAVMGR